jgi:AcrR family transcriptional regulator
MAYRRTERVIQRFNARRDAIVDAARELAGEGGMEAVQVVPIAARASIASGTVYRYFPSKHDLVTALAEGFAERELAAIRKAADAAPGPLSALAAAVVTFAARCQRNRRLAWAVLAEPVDRELDALRVKCRKSLAREFETRIASAVEAAHLPAQDASLAAAAVLGCLLEGLVGPLAPTIADEARMREAVQALTLAALRALGVVDARARGLIVQAAWPKDEAA